ncbi:ATP-grasp domain-containing protein [Micromonospora sp. NPDC049900]|uniref:ATP-grasp domain-containing protein n=1 Tax=Micromonospora sp. NPDC049900 TaxID=3364275 RepID=UPI0037B9CAE0
MFRVAVIGGRPAPIKGARDLGVDIVLVHQPGQYEESIRPHCERIVHAPLADGEAMLDVLRPLHSERPFDRVLTVSEPWGVPTGHVVDGLGLPGTSEKTARLLKDKALMRERLAKYDLSPVRYRVVRSEREARDFLAAVGGPVVLKPVDGAASRNILRVADAAELGHAWRVHTEAGNTSVLAEEFLSGPVVSVESFSYAGRHLPVGYSEYLVNSYHVEWQVSVPSRLVEPYLPELRDLTVRLLDAVELTEGPSHSEFVLTERGPRVLESHARMGGHAIPELVRRAYGLDLARMWLTVPLGIDALPAESPQPTAGAAIRFLRPEPGEIRAVTVAEDIPAVVKRVPPGELTDVYLPLLGELVDVPVGAVVHKNPGDVITPIQTLADCSSGYVLATGADAESAVATCVLVDQQIQFHT